jgi:hypothetical protein
MQMYVLLYFLWFLCFVALVSCRFRLVYCGVAVTVFVHSSILFTFCIPVQFTPL